MCESVRYSVRDAVEDQLYTVALNVGVKPRLYQNDLFIKPYTPIISESSSIAASNYFIITCILIFR